MPKKLVWTNRFSKDIVLIKKRNYRLDKLKTVIEHVQNSEHLPAQFKAYPLKGKYKGYMECHIEPDWLLIWKEESENIYLTRTGSHSDLFK
jgi:mRNA interferase YafQ